MSEQVTIALPKGRLQEAALAVFARAGVTVPPEELDSRRLWVTDASGRYRFVLVKPSDVPTYVEYGTADVGVCGGDVLSESGADVHAPLDLRVGRCRLVLAGREGEDGRLDARATARVATKYPRVATRWFHARGVPVEVVYLSGSVELAPVLGLADRIVDVVETGRTLVDNGLEVLDTLERCSARLVVNRAAWQLEGPALRGLVAALRMARPDEDRPDEEGA
ncbi:MAG: ATP phosphoribosyltransferase [Planctomycetes bacterium]|nr:ATP phosphoribosyltransferase [Planctomycetota bacterium]